MRWGSTPNSGSRGLANEAHELAVNGGGDFETRYTRSNYADGIRAPQYSSAGSLP